MSFLGRMMNDHVGAYAAQSAFFLVLSFFPFVLLLLSVIQFTPVTEAMIMNMIQTAIPDSFKALVISVVNEIYTRSGSVVPISAVVAVWSAAKGFQALNNGLNVINQVKETRNWFYMRLRAMIFTIIFIVAIVATLLLLVFGRTIQRWMIGNWPWIEGVTAFIMQFRTIVMLFALAVAFLCFYKFLPNRKAKFKYQLPGALLTAVSWAAFSYFFSIYLDHFQGYMTMYGSLTTIILTMLWVYFCMYLFLIGAEVNQMITEDPENNMIREAFEDVREETRERKNEIEEHLEEKKEIWRAKKDKD